LKIAIEHSAEVSAAHKTVRTIVSVVFAAYVLCGGSARAQNVVPITSEPSHHLAISNSYVRAFKVEVPPRAETLYHQHDYDYLYVTIGDSDVTSTRIHEKPVAIKLQDGQVELAKGPFAHKATNDSDKPFRNVTIELLKSVGTPICGLAGGDQSCGVGPGWAGGGGRGPFYAGSSQPLLRSSQLTVDDFRVEDGSEVPPNAIPKPPFLLVAVTDERFRIISQKGTQEVESRPGDVFWQEEPFTKLIALSPHARFIVVSFSASQTQ
jgi:hypothetical protein